MVRAEAIRDLKGKARDYSKTETLEAHLRTLRESRKDFFLTRDELDTIFVWKLGKQYDRVKRHLSKNCERAYEIISKAAFAVSEPEWELEAQLRLGILTSLRGVGLPVASAILALTEPERYCVIDFHGWRAVFEDEPERREFDIPAYIRYLTEIRKLAQELERSVQDTDLAMWEYDLQESEQV